MLFLIGCIFFAVTIIPGAYKGKERSTPIAHPNIKSASRCVWRGVIDDVHMGHSLLVNSLHRAYIS